MDPEWWMSLVVVGESAIEHAQADSDDSESNESRERREDECLGEELPNDAPACCAEGRAHRHLLGASDSAGVNQYGDVRRDDDEKQGDEKPQHREHRPLAFGLTVDEDVGVWHDA